MSKGYNLGIAAEKLAIIFLRLKGYKILEWRFRSYFGEIDIIAKKASVIVIIEVKARYLKTEPYELIKATQISRIKKSAEYFYAKNKKFHDCDLRFDFIEVNKFFFIKHYKNFIC